MKLHIKVNSNVQMNDSVYVDLMLNVRNHNKIGS